MLTNIHIDILHTQTSSLSLSFSAYLLLSFCLFVSLYWAITMLNSVVEFALQALHVCVRYFVYTEYERTTAHTYSKPFRVSVNHLDALIATVCLSHCSAKSNSYHSIIIITRWLFNSTPHSQFNLNDDCNACFWRRIFLYRMSLFSKLLLAIRFKP